MQLKFSQDLEILLERMSYHPLTLQEILDETAQRGFSLFIGLLTVPFLLPMPPGLPTIFGPVTIILSSQMALGKKEPWLPKRIGKTRFPRKLSAQILKKVRSLTKFAERFTRPRWLTIAKHPYVWRVNGICIAWLTLLLMLPIPLTNPLPTIGVLLFVISMLEADGLMMCIAYVWSLIVTLIFVVIVYGLYHGSSYLLN